jgi:type VI protein secretion system component Hcp
MAFNIFISLEGTQAGTSNVVQETAVIDSFSWGVTNPKMVGSASTGAGASKASFTTMTITKPADTRATFMLFRSLTAGTPLKVVTIFVKKVISPDASATVLAITLSNVFVTHIEQLYSQNGAGTQETISLAFEGMTLLMADIAENGQQVYGDSATWNQVAGGSATWNQISNAPATNL